MDKNLVKVYSPKGDMAEVSNLNARDLTDHHGWTYTNVIAAATPTPAPAPVTPVAEPTPTPTPAPTPSDTEVKTDEQTSDDADEQTSDDADEQTSDDADETASDETAADESDETVKDEVTAAQFAALTTREDVVALLADQFPSFKPHHKQDRDKLVAKLVELSNAE